MNMKLLLGFLFCLPLFAQPGPGVLQPRRASTTVNYYISTAGSDSNVCSSASKCLTLAHALTLVPQTLNGNYIINVADGTYAEAIDTEGFVGTGIFNGTYNRTLEILGNTTTPANVVFSGTTACVSYLDDGAAEQSGACISGNAKIILAGLTISNGSKFGVQCWGGIIDYNKVVVTLTGGAAAESFGLAHLNCRWNMIGDVTVSGFDTDIAPTGGLGVYNAHGTIGTWTGGTLTITGPAAGAAFDGTAGFVLEYFSGFTMLGASPVLSISGVDTGLVVADSSAFTTSGVSTITIVNGSTPSGDSTGIDLHAGGVVNIGTDGFTGPALTVGHFTKCIFAGALSVLDHLGTRSLTNCTATTATGGSQIILQ